MHPEFGLLTPGAFIGIAEESGLITDLGQWAVREACRQLAQWRAAGLAACPVAVNLTAGDFQGDYLAESVALALEDFKVPASLLEVEVTESALMRVSPATERSTAGIAGLGVRLAIDDFGTGYSSFSYLKRYPFSKIKIDQSFVRDVPNNANDQAIVNAMVSMAQHLKLSVVAEGVETDEQREWLRVAGCGFVQGYLTGKPMPADEAAKLLTVA
jgi:EAL domain-containing protein (putative c-di-GMP-specific phosphodiesterase class I)